MKARQQKTQGGLGLYTICRWLVDSPEFRELSRSARKNRTGVLAEEYIRIADDPNISPNDKRIRIDARLRLIGKWDGKRYVDKVAHKVVTETKFIPLDELIEKIKRIQFQENRFVMVGDPQPA